jgi:hypothetical protein
MNFVRSRLLLVGLVLSVPLLQVSACGQKDRQYAARGDGGEATSPPSEGGTGDVDAGGSSTSSGSPSTGGADVVGEGGTAGIIVIGEGGNGTVIGSGGEGGEPMVDPECVPSGKEVCGDGIDNDCDGETDCLVLRGQFPQIDGAAAGADVRYSFTVPHESATFQCRVGKGVVSGTTWRDCATVDGGAVGPFSAAVSADAASNGVWTTEVRLAFPDGGVSARYRRQVYIHNSMHGAARCSLALPDASYITAAKANLPDAGVFDTSTVKAPFIELDFDPPLSGTFSVTEASGTINLMSLRRRFSFSADNKYLLITRNYTSLKADGMGCTAIEKRVHSSRGGYALGHMTKQTCAALVMNKKGAGFCLAANGASAEYAWAAHPQLPAPTYAPKVDNFAWRKLLQGPSPTIVANFSPKCAAEGCGTASILFLPDIGLFEYWGG